MTHPIQKQILELTLDDGPEKTAVQDEFVRHFQEEVLPEMGDLFDRLAPKDSTLKWETLVVDLGAVSLENFKSELLSELGKTLRRQILEGNGFAEKAEFDLVEKSQKLWRQFLFYLQNGHFQWNANGLNLNQLEKELPTVLPELKASQKAEFFEILKSKNAQKRLAAQFSKPFFAEIVKKTIPFENIQQWVAFFEKIIPENFHKNILLNALFSHSKKRTNHPKIFIENWVFLIEKKLNLTIEEKEDFREVMMEKSKQESEDFQNEMQAVLSLKEKTKEGQAEKEEVEILKDENEHKTDEAIYIQNAGLVLLWPYLEKFFENLNWVANGKFTHREAREKAARLLQCMAFPNEKITENLLPLNKILCGMDVQDLIPDYDGNGDCFSFEKWEKELAKELLESVIKNWPKLGNTSVKGFQTSFLQREGKLERKNPAQAGQGGWFLKVEQRPFDMLLESLPWPLNIIKLKWMHQPLHVEWH